MSARRREAEWLLGLDDRERLLEARVLAACEELLRHQRKVKGKGKAVAPRPPPKDPMYAQTRLEDAK